MKTYKVWLLVELLTPNIDIAVGRVVNTLGEIENAHLRWITAEKKKAEEEEEGDPSRP